MPPRIIPILGRLRQDIAAGLSKETIEGRAASVTTPGGDGSSTRPPPSTCSYSRSSTATPPASMSSTSATGRSPAALLPSSKAAPAGRLSLRSLEMIAATSPRPPPRADRDGSGIGSGSSTAPASPCPTPRTARPLRPARQPAAKGCGFPVAKWLRPVRPHAPACCSARDGAVAQPRDVAGRDDLAGVGTRRPGPGRSWILFLRPSGPAGRPRVARPVPDPSKQIVDFTPGRPGTRGGSKDVPGLPRSRWVLAQGIPIRSSSGPSRRRGHRG